MNTIYQDAANQVVAKWLQDSEKARVLYETTSRLNSNFYDKHYVDFLLQNGNPRKRYYDTTDALPFCILHYHLQKGDIVVCDLPIYREPMSDDSYYENKKILEESLKQLVPVADTSLPVTFNVDVWGGTQDADGILKWSPVLAFSRMNQQQAIWLPTTEVSLEIGYQDGTKTLMQIRGQTGLARWPYGSKTVRVFVWHNESNRFPEDFGFQWKQRQVA